MYCSAPQGWLVLARQAQAVMRTLTQMAWGCAAVTRTQRQPRLTPLLQQQQQQASVVVAAMLLVMWRA
jgi:hypothetical protein